MMRQSGIKILILVLALGGLGALLIPAASAQPAAQSGNLLENPGFEEPFVEFVWADGSGWVASPWQPWYYNDEGAYYDAPEFKQAKIAYDPYRVRSGTNSQQYFKDWARHLAGLYQVVNVPANSKLLFTVYGHAWSSFCDTTDEGSKKDPKCDPRDSNKGGINPIAMKIGIDPTGGTDPFSANIVWGEARGVYDNWEIFEVEATAKGSTISVWIYSTPEYPSAKINVYWDDAALVTTSGGSGSKPATTPTPGSGTPSATPKPGGTPAPTATYKPGSVPPVQTQPPDPDGAQYHVVQQGETLFGISLAYDVSVDDLMAQNGLTNGNQLYVGQKLLIRAAPPAPPATPTPEVTATPIPQPTEVAIVETGQICTALFEDNNADGLRQDGEGLLAGGLLNISGQTSNSHTTDGVSEPFCFSDLAAGDYLISVDPPAGYRLSSIAQMPLTLSGGSEITLSFGAVKAEPEPEAPVEEESGSGGINLSGRTGLLIGAAGLGAVLLLGGVVALVVLFSRKRPAEEAESKVEATPGGGDESEPPAPAE